MCSVFWEKCTLPDAAVCVDPNLLEARKTAKFIHLYWPTTSIFFFFFTVFWEQQAMTWKPTSPSSWCIPAITPWKDTSPRDGRKGLDFTSESEEAPLEKEVCIVPSTGSKSSSVSDAVWREFTVCWTHRMSLIPSWCSERLYWSYPSRKLGEPVSLLSALSPGNKKKMLFFSRKKSNF